MPKKNANAQKITSLILIIGFFSLLLSSCTQKVNDTNNASCQQSDSCLTLTTKNSAITFDADVIIAETPIKLTIKSPDKKISKVWLTAQNMNMGNVPLFLNEVKPGQYIGLLMIGMCNEPIMQWHLNIKYMDGSLELVKLESSWSREHAESAN